MIMMIMNAISVAKREDLSKTAIYFQPQINLRLKNYLTNFVYVNLHIYAQLSIENL
jgi:hypothetical protein